MPRTKGSKNRPKTNITKDYATQIAEKQETIASLNAEIASITANEYYGAAEPPVRCGESHLSGLTEPPHFVY